MTDNLPAAIPWYNSTILRGILTIVVTQVIGRLQSQYHIDTTLLGLSVNDFVSWIMDIISAAALAYMARGRVSQKVSSIITTTQAAADKINSDNPAGVPHVIPTPPSDPDAHPPA